MMNRESGYIYWSLLLGGFSLSLSVFSIYLLSLQSSYLIDFLFINSSSMSMSFSLYFDWMSCLFFSFVAFISCFVILYSGSYMGSDSNIERFLVLVVAFVLSMFLLVFSLNLVSILLGWDGLGIVSYILVVYYQNEKSNAAGMITALSNRVGDAAILLGIAVMSEMGSWDFMSLKSMGFSFSLVGLMVLAAMTKSAQMPFSAWLPAAMAAPTPVSALVHSSTLVTAGVYLLIRFSPYVTELSLGYWLFAIGSLTTFMASVSANFETDLKKVVALSTLSQLGIMMSTLALGLSVLAFFHLLTHAIFKALLFLCSGKVIHESGDTQDGRAMGSLLVSLPFTSMCMNLSNLALCGFPFLAGFYSKDLLIEKSLMTDLGSLSLVILAFNVGLSASYSVRFSFISMINYTNLPILSSSKEEDLNMGVAKVSLSLMAIISGSSLAWMIFPESNLVVLPLSLKLFALGSTVMGGLVGLGLSLSSKIPKVLLGAHNLFSLLIQMWFLPLLSGDKLGKSGTSFGLKMKSMDLGWWEFFGGRGIYSSVLVSTSTISVWQKNLVKSSIMMFLSILMIALISFSSSL